MIKIKKSLILIFTFLLIFCGCDSDSLNKDNASITAKTSKVYKAVEKIDHYVMDTDDEKCASNQVKKIYKKLVDAVYQRKNKIYLSKSYDDNLYALTILKSNPAYFVVKDISFFNNHNSVKIYYNYKKAEHDDILDFIDREYLNVLNEIIKPQFNELDKVLAVYKYFSSRIEYDYEWIDCRDNSFDEYSFPDISVYEALKTDKGVCHSYCYLCKYAYQQLGIKCFCITGNLVGDSDEIHMWLVVNINGKYYHCDPTWDRHEEGFVGLRYFGLTDKERKQDIVFDTRVDIDNNFGTVKCYDASFKSFHNEDISDFDFDVKGKMIVEKGNGKNCYFNTNTLEFEN